MAERLRRRRHAPPNLPLMRAVEMQLGIELAAEKRDKAVLAAAQAGWSMREIGAELGLSASTVCRIVNAAEQAA